MKLRRPILLAAACMAVVIGNAQACPHGSTSKTAALLAPNSTRTAALVAWKPRAWSPTTPLHALQSLQSSGMRVAIDPVDGTMGMPSPDQMSQQLVIDDDSPVQIDRAADGTLTAHLDDRWAEFAVARLGSDGKPDWTCVEGRAGAARFVREVRLPVLPVAPKREDR